jgi:hypothetical protein
MRTFRDELTRPGVNWDALEAFEQFCRTTVQADRVSILTELDDGTVRALSVAEAR